MATYNTIPNPEEAAAAPLISEKPKSSRKMAATVAAICIASAVAGTQAPRAVMSLSSYFAAGERLQLSAWAEKSGESMCLAVKGNADVKTGTDLTIWSCDDPKGKMWDFVGSTRNGGTFQMKYTGPTKEKFSLCVAGQKAGGSRDFGSGSQYYLYECKNNDDTQLFKMEGRHVHWKYDMDLCLDAKNRYNGDKLANGNPVQAYTCEKGDNYNQNWKVI